MSPRVESLEDDLDSTLGDAWVEPFVEEGIETLGRMLAEDQQYQREHGEEPLDTSMYETPEEKEGEWA